MLEINVAKLLKDQGIDVTTEEGAALQTQWEFIQSLKKDADQAIDNTQDIVLTQKANRG
ncbi:hypothetical protein AB3U99_21385 [Niallia sp. JL1B1071]|uniref:hypothetical protein n=1 Tax=Niallia tiangongensis TaxID=3237105 RepID=UPI0037DDDB53